MNKIVKDYPFADADSQFVSNLCQEVYVHLKGTNKTRLAAFYQSFNASVNNSYQRARDLLLQYNIADGNTQNLNLNPRERVAFNRAMVQLGLCAFNLGKIDECKEVLDDICTSFKLSELLQQSIPKNSQNRDDKRKLLPYHLHLSIEKIQSIYLICIMLVEIPKLLSHEISTSRSKNIQVNKIFLKLWSVYEKNSVYGAPENYKDLIYLAIKELSTGDWEASLGYIKQLKFWKKLQNSEGVLDLITHKIKQQGFKCFVLSMKRSFHQLNFTRLSQLFVIEESEVKRIIFDMIHNKEIEARIDVASGSLYFGNHEVNDITKLSHEMNQRLQNNVTMNEKLFNLRYGGGDYQDLVSYGEGVQQKKVSSSKKPVLLGR